MVKTVKYYVGRERSLRVEDRNRTYEEGKFLERDGEYYYKPKGEEEIKVSANRLKLREGKLVLLSSQPKNGKYGFVARTRYHK